MAVQAAVNPKRADYPRKIVSGGQTGVDRAALDVALELGLPCGGWCPRGRRAEDGFITAVYPLQETDSDQYAPRTARNVFDADATLIITRGEPTGGTALTVEIAKRTKRPCMVVDLARGADTSAVRRWLLQEHVVTLNVAGPRESNCSGIYNEALVFLRGLLSSGPDA
jgi:predicted Rossmann fold nucleotide-binding protein DprA/Smf involved in DNA uptake